MVKNIGWIFRHNDGYGDEGGNSGSSGHFKGSVATSVSKECTQNSGDANKEKKLPTKIVIDTVEIEKKDFPEFDKIWDHVSACVDFERDEYEGSNDSWFDRYTNAVTKYKKKKKISFLCFHDANTVGLTGPIDGKGKKSNLNAIKGRGKSGKEKSDGGSFGHGASSVINLSGCYSVFYYSLVKENPKERFLGKAELATHKHPDTKKETRALGYFANDDAAITPLTGSDIPAWARDFRNEKVSGTGTSIYIPYPDFKDKHFEEITLSLISNFYMAFKEKLLEVDVRGLSIDSSNVDSLYRRYRKKFEDGMYLDANTNKHLAKCFESIDAIQKADIEDVSQVNGIGKIKWSLHFPENSTRHSVCISRAAGMFITNDAPQLRQFHDIKPFLMHVRVVDELGNNILRDLENERHDAFEFERIKDFSDDKRATINRAYKNLKEKIRDLLKKHAVIKVSDEAEINELAELFGAIEDGSSAGMNNERGQDIIVSDGPLKALKSSITGGKLPGSGKEGLGGGITGGTGSVTNPGGNVNPGSMPITVPGQGSKSAKSTGNKYFLRNLSITKIQPNGKEIDICYDPPKSGNFNLELFRKGENGKESIPLEAGSQSLNFPDTQRRKSTVKLKVDISNFVVEGVLHEVV